MRRTILRSGGSGVLGLLVALTTVSCDSGSAAPTTTAVAATPMVETRVGTVGAHGFGYINFSMEKAGLVTLKVDPVLLLTLRSGKVPQEFGQFIANSDNGGLTIEAPAGTNSVVVGNPFDTDKSFTLTITHP